MRALIFTILGLSFICEPAFAKSVRDAKLLLSVKKTGTYATQLTRVFHRGARGGKFYCTTELTPFHSLEKSETAKSLVAEAKRVIKAHPGYAKGCTQIVMVHVPGQKAGSLCTDSADASLLLSKLAADCGR